jgi:hypothetical protein
VQQAKINLDSFTEYDVGKTLSTKSAALTSCESNWSLQTLILKRQNYLTNLKQNNAGTVEYENQWLNWNDIGPSVIHNDYITMQPILLLLFHFRFRNKLW